MMIILYIDYSFINSPQVLFVLFLGCGPQYRIYVSNIEIKNKEESFSRPGIDKKKQSSSVLRVVIDTAD